MLVKVMVDSRENAQRAKELWNDSSVYRFSSQLFSDNAVCFDNA